MGATYIDLQRDCCDVTSISVRNCSQVCSRRRMSMCVGDWRHVFGVCECACELARLRSSNSSQNRITGGGGGGEWPGSIFHETSPPYRISITSDDLLSFLLPPFLICHPPPFTPPLCHQYLRTPSFFVSPLSSGVSFPSRPSPLPSLSLLVLLLLAPLPLPRWGGL